MDSLQCNASMDSSSTSSCYDTKEDTCLVDMKKHCKDLLKGQIFLGRYIERRLVSQSLGYRDIVIISGAEKEFIKDLVEAHNHLSKICPRTWIGIGDTKSIEVSPTGVCLWTEIDNQPFGVFWFQVKTIHFSNEEIFIKLKCIRHLSEAFLDAEPILNQETGRHVNQSKRSKDMSFQSLEEVRVSVKDALTVSNLKELSTFLIAFVIALFTGSSAFINFLGTFVLSLVRELSNGIKNSTPIVLGMLDFLSKIVGGFYLLLAMFFRPSPAVNQYPDRRLSRNSKRERNYEYDNNFD